MLCDGVLTFLLRTDMHCLHWDLLCECSWVIELEVSSTKALWTNPNSLRCNLVAALEQLEKTTPLMQNTIISCNIFIFTYWHLPISFCFMPGLLYWYVFADNLYWEVTRKNDTQTIPERYPKKKLRPLGRRLFTHSHTSTKHWHTKCLGAT